MAAKRFQINVRRVWGQSTIPIQVRVTLTRKRNTSSKVSLYQQNFRKQQLV